MDRGWRKYNREEKAKADKQQATFNTQGKLNPTKQQEAKAQFDIDTNQQVMCAYCLHQNQLHKFLISTKKGFHKSQAKCPECGNGQLIRTLTAEQTPEQYAEWMYMNMMYGGWSKVPFEKWKERLAQLGWARQFWDKYKQLKADYADQPNYEDTLNQQYQEWLKEHGGEE